MKKGEKKFNFRLFNKIFHVFPNFSLEFFFPTCLHHHIIPDGFLNISLCTLLKSKKKQKKKQQQNRISNNKNGGGVEVTIYLGLLLLLLNPGLGR